MAGFIRRFGNFPGVETITQIEGIVIVDLPPPGAIAGVSTGTVGMVGEFSDMTYATAVSAAGLVTTKPQPVQIFSGQDLLDKLGGFHGSIGDHGNSGGNGFVSLRNKQFTQLVVVPINLASPGAGRLYRSLPTNLSATQPLPVVPLLGGTVPSGLEFKSGVNRVKLGRRGTFTALGQFKTGTDGATTSGSSAVTQAFTSAGGGFLTAYKNGPVKKGCIVVIGVIGAGGAQGANAATYRVQADAASDTSLTLEKMDGSAFNWTTGTALVYRIHPPTDADTGGEGGIFAALADNTGYKYPCRPVDATISSGVQLLPKVVPPTGTASSWDPLSDLALASHPSSGFAYVATIQGLNPTNDATIDALYTAAIDALGQDIAPARDVNTVFSSRTSTTIRAKLRSHVLQVSQSGIGRVACISPNLQTVGTAVAIGDGDPGVGATRDERVFYAWPGAQTFIQEAVGESVGTATGSPTTDGMIDTPGDAWLASVLSVLAPERNPGQAGSPVKEALSTVAGLQRGLTSMDMSTYIALRAQGVVGLRIDRTDGAVFQSGVTSSLISGQKNINRRRMADFIQDSVARNLTKFSKLPMTQALKDAAVGEIDSFLDQLLSPNNPAAQRINAYSVDDKSGNTPNLEAQGIFVIIGKVRTTPTADFIVFQSSIGESVVVDTN